MSYQTLVRQEQVEAEIRQEAASGDATTEPETWSSLGAAVLLFFGMPFLILLGFVASGLALVWPSGATFRWLFCQARAAIPVEALHVEGEVCERPAVYWLVLNALAFSYLLWCMCDPACNTGSRFSSCFRSLSIWEAVRSYFPIELEARDVLDPNEGPYILCYHPHGLISVGAFTAFATSSCGWDDGAGAMGVQPHLVTLAINFKLPIFREVLLSLGICSADRDTFRKVLKDKNKALVVVVGGAEEAMASGTDTYDLTLVNRKGFAREAFLAGATLVPVLGFGETGIYSIESSSSIGCFLKLVKQALGFVIPVFNGRFGPLPHRKKVTVVLGDPLPPPEKPENLDIKSPEVQALIDGFHADYVRGLRNLWDEQKEDKAIDRRGTLMFAGQHKSRFTVMAKSKKTSTDEKKG
eukprot:TRINITY_DN93630_c0_g1_i1.p1 TRINITY_DN93630_c0_g1~~TRINITY_DN93630_c0_g1_i1.p1  ORF type:complete len:411 (+),score=50.62 TRINITY_DN93630_c0_g1_i1:65-1297(+)